MNMSSFFVCCFQMGGSLQGAELSLTATKAVTTLAGTGSSGSLNNDNGTLAKFKQPFDITTDGTNLYVADTKNFTIRQIVISTGAVTTLAGTAGSFGKIDNSTGTGASFKNPKGITTDGTNLYVADQSNHRIRQIVISTGAVTTLAGSSAGHTDATGTLAKFSSPCGITTDGTNVYVADTFNYRIRQIVIDNGTVTTLAGTGSAGSADNDNGSLASFDRPYGITTDGTNLFVADSFNDKIRKIVIETRVVTTLAGGGSGTDTDGTGTTASFNGAFGITTDGTNLYVADRDNNKIRKIGIDNRSVTTLAGTGTGGRANGAGSDATFRQPAGITTDGKDLYVIEQGNHLIRKID
jgi:sugar lactone lactonase YvrE